MLDVIIFSKDRPPQLELLLRSMDRFMENVPRKVRVIYTHTTANCRQGYEMVKRMYPSVKFVLEHNFKQDTVQSLRSTECPYIMFLVDDNVFVSEWSMQDWEVAWFARSESLIALSLRMSPGYGYCYTMNQRFTPPDFSELKYHIWNWRKQQGDWGYPMSLDGNLYKRDVVVPLIEIQEYYNPNTLEFALATFSCDVKKKRQWMICYPKAKVLNIPANRVQAEFPNRNMGMSQFEMNDKFIEGERIELELIVQCTPDAPHFPVEFTWQRYT